MSQREHRGNTRRALDLQMGEALDANAFEGLIRVAVTLSGIKGDIRSK